MRDGEKEERTSAGSPPPLPGETGEPSFPAVAAAAGGLDDGDAVETRLGIQLAREEQGRGDGAREREGGEDDALCPSLDHK